MAQHGTPFNEANEDLSLNLQDGAELLQKMDREQRADVARLKADVAKLQTDYTALRSDYEMLQAKLETDLGQVVRYLREWYLNPQTENSTNRNWPHGLENNYPAP